MSEEITNEICGCFKMTVDTNGLKKLEDYITNLEQENKQLNNQLQQKENIIKEVREYIIQEMNNINAITYINILEILDKEVN